MPVSSTSVGGEPFAEVTSKIVWPTIGRFAGGRLIGTLCANPAGIGAFTLGKLLAVAAIPAALAYFGALFLPIFARRYRLTNRRVMILLGLSGQPGPAVGLDEFDSIRVEVLPGQEWLRSGELVFERGGKEVLRLGGVSRPEVFRQICLKARMAMVSVRDVLRHQAAASV